MLTGRDVCMQLCLNITQLSRSCSLELAEHFSVEKICFIHCTLYSVCVNTFMYSILLYQCKWYHCTGKKKCPVPLSDQNRALTHLIKYKNTHTNTSYHPTVWQQIIRPLPLNNKELNSNTDWLSIPMVMILYSGAINTAHKCMKHFLIQKYYSNAINFALEQKSIYKH